MRTTVGTASRVVIVSLLAGCASEPAPLVAAQQTPNCGAEPLRVEFYDGLDELASDSEIIVIGTVTDDLGPLEDYVASSSLNEFTVREVVTGDVAVGERLSVLDPAEPYRCAGSPLSTGTSYVLHLRTLGEFQGPDGQLIDASGVWVSPFPGQYVADGDAWTLDAGTQSDALPAQATRADFDASVAG